MFRKQIDLSAALLSGHGLVEIRGVIERAKAVSPRCSATALNKVHGKF
jgi:hypothetical protein